MDPNIRSSAPKVGASFEKFADWALRTRIAYFFALVLLFGLGLLARFLGAVKVQLERKWRAQSWLRSRYESQAERDSDESEEFQPLKEGGVRRMGEGGRGLWVADGEWDLRRDGVRALLEFGRAVIAYTMMLAVMTYDVGFFFAVTGSVLVGEVVFGRFSRDVHG